MSIKFTSKNVKFTGALKAYTEKNLKSIERISGGLIDVEVIATEEKLDFKVEISVKTRLHSYHIEARDPILKQAIRSTLNTLKSQARKNKEKLKMDKKRKNKANIFQRFIRSSEEPPEPVERPISESITVSNNYSNKPLSIEEAIFFLKDSGENAYLFTNIETNKMSVVFYNKIKSISIIEAT
jgi:putative sigma-54 modulation protein